jgi:hypothetical protein
LSYIKLFYNLKSLSDCEKVSGITAAPGYAFKAENLPLRALPASTQKAGEQSDRSGAPLTPRENITL